ncbi:unnamed protein product [Cyprideis torosa]|uniref:heparosan-N-sulfate-glucuronate 5-epimerase n=1 Tax=Cyprideis torosa TaxID=163714 RepID=A0A7R8WE71_9CRUS|nr:unnamed protein product [Cyprideis torosa]CAG0894028.1 unnamed protein product [Cyprideis torosa]
MHPVTSVPVSNQWYADGHFYPIQIAQFALQHYCKNRTDGPPKVTLVADFDQKQGEWRIPNDKAFVQRVYDSNRSSYIVTFDITHTQGLELEVPQGTSGVFVLTMDVMPKSKNFSFSVSLLEEKTGETYDLHYVNEGELFLFSSSKATYGVHLPLNSWTQFVRDLHVDVLKGKSAANGKKWKMNKARLRVTKIVFRGKGSLNLVTLASSQHSAFFFYGADWFMRHQDENGAWGCTVERRLAGGSVLLPPGWYSAMGQGHAISVLTRAYHVSGDVKYLEAAQRALEPFRRDSSGSGVSSDSSRRGVRAWFLGHLPWYEEYPSDPPSFVLNGFIYSLFGLYDLKDKSSDAKQLFETGLESLLKLLPLFDTGSGSVYDLRHVSLGIAPNLARWDYHTVHINQLTHLATIIDAPLLNETAKRWASYLKGKRASHN